MLVRTSTRTALAAILVASLVVATRGAPAHAAAAGAARLVIISLVDAATSGARSGTIRVGTIDEGVIAVRRIPVRAKPKKQVLDLVRGYEGPDREILVLAPTARVASDQPTRLRLGGETLRWNRVSDIVDEDRIGLLDCETPGACNRWIDRSTAVKDGKELLGKAWDLLTTAADAEDLEFFLDTRDRPQCAP